MLAIRLFGGFSVERDGRAVELASRPAQTLLAYLALHRDQPHRRERLAGLIWPDAADSNGRNNLRHTLWRIRGALAEAASCIAADRVGVALVLGPDLLIDVAELERIVPARASITELTDALGRCTGELLAGFYDDWVQIERDRIAAVHDRAARALVDALIAAGQWRDVVPWAEHWIGAAPVPEAAFRALMRAHAELGDQAAVETVFRRVVAALDTELEADVSPETQALYRQLTEHPPAARAIAPTLPHARARYRLPAETTSFVGRDRELGVLATLLAEPTTRLVTIVGPGGAGKTRLAMRAAAAAAERFTDGACVVALEAVDTVDELPVAIADALGLALVGRDPAADQVHDALRDRSVLLVLDNFEQLVDAAGVIAALLVAAPAVKALVTSRERLAIRAEHLLAVSGIDPTAAIELFCARARQLAPAFAPDADERAAIQRTCRTLDDFPLGIELAAALAPAEGCAAIAREVERSAGDLASALRDQPERHRSLRAVFDHSRRMLDPEDDRLLAAIAVFRGGFTVEAAAAIAAATPDGLARLVDKSLVIRRDGRHRLHEAVRQLAAELTPGAAADRHAVWYCARLGDQARALVGVDQRAAMAAVVGDLDNVRAAWRHAIRCGDTAAIDSAVDGLTVLLDRRSAFVDGEQLFRHAVDQLAAPPRLHARLRARHAAFAYHLGDMARAKELAEASLAEARTGGDTREQAFALYVLGRVAYRTSQLDHAEAALRESAELSRTAGDAAATGASLSALGMVATTRGEYAAARALQGEAIVVLEAIGDASGAARAENHLGIVEGAEGNYDRAEHLLRHSLAVWRDIGNHASAATALNNLGVIAERRGDLHAARLAQEEGLELRRAIGDRFGVSYSLSNLGIIARKQARHDDARRCLEECLDLRRRLGDRAGASLALLNLGRVHADLGELDAATARWSEALDAALAARARPRALEVMVEVGCLLARTGARADAAIVLGYASSTPTLEQVDRERASRVLTELGGHGEPAAIAAVADVLRRALGVENEVGQQFVELCG